MNNNELKIGTFNLGHSSLIEASAGTGKTYTITYLVLRLLLGSQGFGEKGSDVKKEYGYHAGPLELKNILVVTFTNAATSDLRARIREKIVAARIAFEKVAKRGMEILDSLELEDPLNYLIHELIDNQDEESKTARTCALLLLNAERSIDDAPICTIHSFCTSALHKIYTFEAGEPFDVELCQDVSEQTKEARNTVWRELFYKGDSNSEKLAALLSADSDQELFSTLSKYQKKLGRVRNTNSKDGFFGYSLLNVKDNNCNDIRKNISKVIETLDGYLDEFSVCVDNCKSIFDEYKDEVITKDNQPGELFTRIDGKISAFTDKVSLPAYVQLRDTCATQDDTERRLACIRGNFNVEIEFRSISRLRDRAKYSSAFKYPEKIIELEEQFMKMSSLHNKALSLKGVIIFDIAIMVEQKLDEILERDHLIGLDGIIRRLDYVLNYKDGSKDILPGLIRASYPVAMIDEFQDTDPVQFSIFSKLYLNEAAKKTGACCYLIGDPKQSIYGFRRADIHSYLKARALIENLYGSDSIYTLSTNFRSQEQIVEGVNKVFSLREDPFFFDKNSKDNIEFSEVKAKVKSLGNSGKCSFRFSNIESPSDSFSASSNYVEFLSAEAFSKECPDTSFCKTNSKDYIARKLARAVQLCLSHGILDSVSGDKVVSRAVKPSDIAILVRMGDEAKHLQSALKDLNISSVYYSDNSKVFDEASSENSFAEYELLLYLIDAMDDYANRGKVKTLLLSQLCSASENENLEALGDSIELEVSLLKECRLIWEKTGFFPAFSKWASDERHQCLKNNLRFTGGERMVTNLWHLAELLQSARAHEQGIQAQKRWYLELRTNTSLNSDSDMFKKRLESEASQVAIYTIFKSKGLEFPLVFMPYIWTDMRIVNKGDAYYYDETEGKLYFDILGEEKTLKQKTESDLQEDARLLYVALTRACAANFIYIPQWNIKNANALVSEFVSSDMSPYSNAELILSDSLESTEAPSSSATNPSCSKSNPFKLVDEEFYAEVLKSKPVFDDNSQENKITGPSEFAESFERIRQDYRISSYSGIVARQEDGSPSHKSEDLEIPKDAFTRFNFPRNAIAGTYLHNIMEHCDFANSQSQEVIAASIDNASHTKEAGILKRWHINHMSSDKDKVLEQKNLALNAWISDVVRAKLPCGKSETICLCDLKKGDWLSELEFLFPSDKFTSDNLEALRQKNAAVFSQEKGITLDNINFSLAQSELSGFVKGFIDLAIKVGDGADAKFYVIDYKSNFMGISYDDYDEKSVSLNMLEHCYDVQYLFYSLAMHRFLQHRIENYDYEKHFGGVIYLYLRGMQENSSNSVVYTKPKLEHIEELSRIFSK